MQIELENLAWDRKELHQHLQTAIKEHKMLELILAELEEEHDKAIAKIELLEGEVMISFSGRLDKLYLLWFHSVHVFCKFQR